MLWSDCEGKISMIKYFIFYYQKSEKVDSNEVAVLEYVSLIAATSNTNGMTEVGILDAKTPSGFIKGLEAKEIWVKLR